MEHFHFFSYRYYWIIYTSSTLWYQSAALAYCKWMHPQMSLAELEQVGEYTAVATNYILTPAVKGS